MDDSGHDCETTRAALWRYVDREMPAREMAWISAGLRDCEDCRRVYEELARQSRLLSMAFSETPFGGTGFVARFRERAAEERLGRVHPRRRIGSILRLFGGTKAEGASSGDAALGAGGVDEVFEDLISECGSSRRRRYRKLAVAAAFLLIPTVIALGIYLTGSGLAPLGRYRVDGEGFVRVLDLENGSGGIHSDAQPSGPFHAGMRFVVPARTTLKLHLGEGVALVNAAEIEIVGPAELRIPRDSTVGEFLGHLERGEMRALVATRSVDESFVVRTRHHGIKVIGTEFVLETDGHRTKLTVTEGKVAFGHPGVDGRIYDEHVVHAGESLALAAGGTDAPAAVSSRTGVGSDVGEEPAAEAASAPTVVEPPVSAGPRTGEPARAGKPVTGVGPRVDLDNVVGPGAGSSGPETRDGSSGQEPAQGAPHRPDGGRSHRPRDGSQRNPD